MGELLLSHHDRTHTKFPTIPMGTSVKIIEDYYGRYATPVQSAAKLGGRVREV